MEELNTFYGVITVLTPVAQLSTDLFTLISVRRMTAGIEALQNVLCYYNNTKQALKENISSAKDIYTDMKKGYERKKKNRKPIATKKKETKKVEIEKNKGDNSDLNVAS